MRSEDLKAYEHLRNGGSGFHEQKRGLIAVWGKEAVQFLDGMITNDMKTLEDGQQMLAAFPNAEGRLLAVVRILRQGDRFLIETEEATRGKVYQNLFRFTFAGDFFVDDMSDRFRFFQVHGFNIPGPATVFQFEAIREDGLTYAVPFEEYVGFCRAITDREFFEITADLYETLRIESGTPKYGVDMDETTIVPELGLDDMISYTKGCYIGQEIIARIHFRGHVAKRLTGLVSESPAANGLAPGAELKTADGRNAGRVTSVTYSPKLDRTIALAFVRYDYLTEETELKAGDAVTSVTKLPFID